MKVTKSENAIQSIDNLKGEIEFRSKLAIQHVSGEILLPDYYNREEHDRILLERVETTHQKMAALKELGIHFSPFLELGAERGQRSLVLTNDFGAEGVAVDISFHQLRTMKHFSKLFQREKLPLRICCNAYHLPFVNNSFPFIFCYQFLHHFPTLDPVMNEIYRVLSDGYFYFDEEPYQRVLKFNLYRQQTKPYSKITRTRNRYLNLIESFLSESACDEVEHGIIENHSIALVEWIDALALFSEHNLNLSSIYNISSSLGTRLQLRNIPNYLLGGIISGLCRKTAQGKDSSLKKVTDLLACPECLIPKRSGRFDRPQLVQFSDGFRCPLCETHYPIRDGVLLLLPKAELHQLYPDF